MVLVEKSAMMALKNTPPLLVSWKLEEKCLHIIFAKFFYTMLWKKSINKSISHIFSMNYIFSQLQTSFYIQFTDKEEAAAES